MYYAIIGLGAFALVGFVIYLWQNDKNKETRRLYQWQDDIFDRIGAGEIERYAFTQRIKHEIGKTQTPTIEDKMAEKTLPPKFVHQK